MPRVRPADDEEPPCQRVMRWRRRQQQQQQQQQQQRWCGDCSGDTSKIVDYSGTESTSCIFVGRRIRAIEDVDDAIRTAARVRLLVNVGSRRSGGGDAEATATTKINMDASVFV